MKSTKTIKRLAAIFSSALLLAVSCKNGLEPETANVKFSVSEDARTILPQINVSDFSDLELSEKGESKNTLLGSYSTLEELTDAELEMTPGDYTFILTANDNGTTLSGTTAITIVKGDNTVSFNMQISDYGTEDGSVEITLIVPTTDDLLEAQYEFVNVDDDSIYYDATIGDQTISNEAGTSSIPFSVSAVKPGTYQLKLAYYIDTDNYVAYSTIVRVSAGVVSKGEFECEGIVNDPVEWPEILDLRNVFENSDEEEDGSRRIGVNNIAKKYTERFTAKANREMHRNFIDKTEYKVTKPVDDPELKNKGVGYKNQLNLTDAEINSLFTFEPVADGVQITVNVPDSVYTDKLGTVDVRIYYVDGDVPEGCGHYGDVEDYELTHHLSTSQDVLFTDAEKTAKTKTWVYPLLDPTRDSEKVRLLAQLAPYYTDKGELQTQNLYDVYCGGGIGCIPDLPVGWGERNSLRDYAELGWDNGKYTFIINNTKIPEQTSTCSIKNLRSLVSLFGTTNESKYYYVDEDGNSDYMSYVQKEYPLSDGFITKVVFDNELLFRNQVVNEPYLWMYMGYEYEIDGYEGTFMSPVVNSKIIKNDQYFNNLNNRTYPDYLDITNERQRWDEKNCLDLSLIENYSDDYCLIVEAEHLSATTDTEYEPVFIHGPNWQGYYNDSLLSFAAKEAGTFTKKILVSDLLNLYDGNLYININPDITNWNVKFYLSKRSTDVATVSFGNYDKESFKVCTGVDITDKLPELTPTDNKIFIEWYTDKDYTQAFTGTVSDNTTLYYKWNDIKDIMSLLDGQNFFKEDLQQYAGMALQYTVHHPASTSSKWAGFLGWTYSDYYESDMTTTADTTLTYTHVVDDMLSKTCIKAEWNNNKEYFNFNLGDAWTLESLVIINEDPSTITFNYQDGTEPTTISAYDGDNITGQLPSPAREHYIFDGWYTNIEYTEPFSGTVAGDATLFAKWTDLSRTITLNYQDGTEPTTITAYDGDDITSQLPTPTSADKLFDGWYTNIEYTEPFSGTVAGDATLFAKWTDLSRTITLNYQNSTESTSISAYDGDDITSQLPTPTSADKLFAGWYTDSGCSTEFNGIVNGDATLYAKWSDEVVLTAEKVEFVDISYYFYNFSNLEVYRSYTDAVISITVKNTSEEKKDIRLEVLSKQPFLSSSEEVAAGETKTFTCNISDFTDEWIDDDGHIGLRINSDVNFELVSAVIQIPNE